MASLTIHFSIPVIMKIVISTTFVNFCLCLPLQKFTSIAHSIVVFSDSNYLCHILEARQITKLLANARSRRRWNLERRRLMLNCCGNFLTSHVNQKMTTMAVARNSTAAVNSCFDFYQMSIKIQLFDLSLLFSLWQACIFQLVTNDRF
jgi:hypothetical protein